MPVTLTGRDELGRIIDVTVDTVANVPPPGPEEIAAGPGGAAEPGTVVVTEGLEGDIAAALEAANAMSAANPAATLADVSGQLSVTRTVTSAEILTLHSEPIELLAGVPGTIHWALAGLVTLHFGTIPYLAGAQALVVAPGETTAHLMMLASSEILEETQDVYAVLGVFDNGGVRFYSVDGDGAPMLFMTDVDDPTAGDGTLDVTVFYRDITV